MKNNVPVLMMIFLFSCNLHKNVENNKKYSSLKWDKRFDCTKDINHFSTRFLTLDEKTYFVYINKKDSCVDVKNMHTSEVETHYTLKSIINQHPKIDILGKYTFFNVLNFDSLLVRSHGFGNKLLMLNKNGEVINRYYFYDENKLLSVSKNINLNWIQGKPFSHCVSKLMVQPDFSFDMFEVPPDVTLNKNNIKDKNQYEFYGRWPQKYKTKFYKDYHPYRIVVESENKTNLVYSFCGSDSLLIQDYSTKKMINALSKSDYFNEIPEYDLDSLKYIGYLKNYLTIEPRYKEIIHDPYRNLYYRIALLKNERENPTPLIRDFSVIVMDKDFEKINEKKFDGEIYRYQIVPSKNGIFVKLQDQSVNNQIKYEVFDSFID